MSQTETLVSTLKMILKQNGKTYKDVAEILNLSEASVKRKFSDKNFTLKRLEKILDRLGMDIADLVLAMRKEQWKFTELTHQQEQKIVSDPKLLIVTVLALHNWSLGEIVRHFHIKKTECISYLLQLDKLNLIELQPNNRIKLLVPPDFTWRLGGPIQNFFIKNIAAEFLESDFEEEGNTLICLNGMMTSFNKNSIERAMNQLATQFHEAALEATSLPLSKKWGTTLVLAMRDWNFSIFEPYRK